MLTRGYYSGTSPEGQNLGDRLTVAGYEYSMWGENIEGAFSATPRDETEASLEIHDSLFTDANSSERNHRVRMLREGYKEIGIGGVSGLHTGYGYECYMLTCDFATSLTNPNPFVTGVVYEDQDSDGAYTSGEGMAGISIIAEESGGATVTASAGGYGIPLAQGDHTLRAVLPDGREAVRQITIPDQNVKADFLISDFSFQAPAVTIGVSPLTVREGESAVLTWHSDHADSAVIDKGVGNVPASGSVTVSPAVTTVYTVTVTGPAGTASAEVLLSVSPIRLTITFPAEGEDISGPYAMVRGTVGNDTGNQTGVVINGVPAHVSNGEFFVNHVFLGDEGENTLETVITDTGGNTRTSVTTVNAAFSDERITLSASPESGLAPLSVRLTADLTLRNPAAESSVTWTGPSQEDISMTELTEYELVFDTPGIHTVTYQVTDDQGVPHQQDIMISVLARESTKQFFRTLWENMRNALIGGDTDRAVSYFLPGRRAAYDEVFRALPAGQAGNILPGPDRTELVGCSDSAARCVIDTDISVNGEQMTVSSYLIFEKDTDGLWRIVFF